LAENAMHKPDKPELKRAWLIREITNSKFQITNNSKRYKKNKKLVQKRSFYDKIDMEVKMSQIILDIKNNVKGKYLLDFLRQIDFVEIKEGLEEQAKDKKAFEEALLNAPVLTDEEIQNIENVGKEFI
jgi:hypothetical protein